MVTMKKLAMTTCNRPRTVNKADLARRCRVALTGLLIGVFLAQPTSSATQIHRDGGGYTYRSSDGGTTYSYRLDTGATYYRTGNAATYRDNSGTSGVSMYGGQGRYDSYSNAREGWTGSGYTPYSSPSLTTYTRTSTKGLLGRDDQTGSTGAITASPCGSSSFLGLLALLGGGVGLASWLTKQKASSSAG